MSIDVWYVFRAETFDVNYNNVRGELFIYLLLGLFLLQLLMFITLLL